MVNPVQKPPEERRLSNVTEFFLELIYGIVLGGVIFACLVFILLAIQDIKFSAQQPIPTILSEYTVYYQLLGICGVIIIFNCCKIAFYSYVKIIGVLLGILFMLYWFDTMFIPNLFEMI
jgi:hypothetical protein